MFGVVLEGGGTKGAYHIGAFKALKELNIDIDCIVGASIGAVNGALFAQGDWDKANEVWTRISPQDILLMPEKMAEYKNIFDIHNLQSIFNEIKQNKGLDITPFDKLIREYIDEDKIRSSEVDFGLVTFNVTDGKEQALFLKDIPRNKLADYVIASACFPLFKPKRIDNSTFIDGGVTNNLPVDMLIRKGYRNIITVEVGGVGISKKVSGGGCNIINIKTGSGDVGTLDFNEKYIYEAKEIGYLETYKTFGKLTGEKFYFDTPNYNENKLKYGAKLLRELETAASVFELDRLNVYTVEEMVAEVLKRYRETNGYDSIIEVFKKSEKEKVAALAKAIIKSDAEILESNIVAGLLGNMFDAASAIAYFVQEPTDVN